MDVVEIKPGMHVLVLTGAGVSAESGIPTFRAMPGALWENHPVEQVASPEGFRRDPALVWKFYSQRRERAKGVKPNPGHEALARLEQKLGDRFLLVTQNVDGLHQRAGSRRVVELHGNLFRTRCSVCDRPAFRDETVYPPGEVPWCEICERKGRKSALRPDIVWFGEMLNPDDLARVDAFVALAAKRGRWLFVAVGTSGVVYPAAGMVDLARRNGADTWLINVEPAENTHRFAHFIQGKSGEILPRVFRVNEGD